VSNWKETLILHTEDISEALVNINKGGLGIGCVVDEKHHLIGTITDGDIRRGLLNRIDLSENVKTIMNTEPKTASLSDSKTYILDLMKIYDLSHVPVISEEGKLCNIETIASIVNNTPYENTVFLMAGGFGKRLHPLTEHTPKPLLDVGGEPIIDRIINSFIHVGFKNFVVSTHYKADKIIQHLGDGACRGVSIKYVHEDSPLGTAGSLSLLAEESINKPIIVMNSDILTNIDFRQLLNFHNESNAIATICARNYDIKVPFGVISSTNHIVESIVEKPVSNYFVNAGIYVLDPKCIKDINYNEYLDMTTFLQQRIDTGDTVTVFPLYENWHDIGRHEDYEISHSLV
jgi:dTDP-glucose pyrophosphorylase